MGLFSVGYNISLANFRVSGIKAGNATEMESNLQDMIRSAAGYPSGLIDVTLCAVGEGPEWEAAAVFGTAGSGLPARSTVRVAAAVALDAAEAMRSLTARLAAIHAVTPLAELLKVEFAGGGLGTKMLALAIAVES